MDTVILSFKKNNKEYQMIDLNKENFDPVLNEGELSLYSKGECIDESVKKYQDMIRESDQLVFIFPIWWYYLPAILKGFIDKVMLKNFAYTEGKYGLQGLLVHIKKTTVITTSQAPSWYLKHIAGNPIQKIFIKGTLNSIGIKNAVWLY
jgi:putative NADPH-quinone reductase